MAALNKFRESDWITIVSWVLASIGITMIVVKVGWVVAIGIFLLLWAYSAGEMATKKRQEEYKREISVESRRFVERLKAAAAQQGRETNGG